MQRSSFLGGLLRWTAWICIATVCGAFVTVIIVTSVHLAASLILPQTMQLSILDRLGLEYEYAQYATSVKAGGLNEARREVSPDVIAIAQWIGRCTKTTDLTPYIPLEYAQWSPGPPDVDLTRPRRPVFHEDSVIETVPNETKPREMNNQEMALVQLNRSLADHRLAARSKAQSAYSFWQLSTLVTIVIGMITTILVSLSTTDFGRGDTAGPRLIRVLAIAFPALGTAAAAIVGFYGPQAEWSQSSRTLASLSQLHDQIALEIWKVEDCTTAGTKTGDLAKRVDEWSKRYADIQALANAASASSGPSGQGGQSQNAAEGGNKATTTAITNTTSTPKRVEP